MKNTIYIIILLFFAYPAIAQHGFKGKVVDKEDNRPIEGASIIGPSFETTTDRNGLFFVKGPLESSAVEIRHIGFKAYTLKIDTISKSAVLVYLSKEENRLDDVIVSSGYQQLSKERVTGAYSVINNKTLNEQVSTNIMERLPVVGNGLLMDNNRDRLLVRGYSTLGGPTEPLIVLDDFPYEGDIGNINPNDVENITILKDAAAASIWGAKAGNGVIVITTKKGQRNQPLRFNFVSNLTWAGKPDLFYIPQMPAGEYIDSDKMLFAAGFFNNDINSDRMPMLSPVVELLIKNANAELSDTELEKQLDSFRKTDVRSELLRSAYSNAFNQQYAFNAAGGVARHSWYVSAGMDRNKDQLSNTFQRHNLSFKNTFDLFDKLTLAGAVYYTNVANKSGRQGYDIIKSKNAALLPYTRLADEEGKALPVFQKYRSTYIDSAGNGKLLDWKYYPFDDYKHLNNSTKGTDVLINFGLDYKIIDGFKFHLKYQYEHEINKNDFNYGKESFYTRDLINNFTQLGPNGKQEYPVPVGDIVDMQTNTLNAYQFRSQLDIDKNWGDHGIVGLIGGEARNYFREISKERVYGFNTENFGYAEVNPTDTYTTLVTGANEYIEYAKNFNETTTRFLSFYGNMAYTYREKYIATLSGRRDASNLFGLETNDKWKPLWSAGVGWIISKEPLLSDRWIDFLKLRLTYGHSGNVDGGRSSVTTIAQFTLSPFVNQYVNRFDQYANPDLKWENAAQLNIGADFRLLGNRINGSIDYFRKKGTDLYSLAPLDYTFGIGSRIVKNSASIKGSGIDAELNTVNIKSALSWDTHLNLSLNRDEIVDYYLPSVRGRDFVSNSSSFRVSGIEGKTLYGVYTYRDAGLNPETGMPRGYLDGEISESYSKIIGEATKIEDLDFHGSAVPTFYGSLGNTFSWRQFSASVWVSYKFNYYVKRKSIDYGDLYNNWNGHRDIVDRWKKSGDEQFTSIPAMVYPVPSSMQAFYDGTSGLIEKGDHIRLQYINLNYTFNNNTAFKNLTLQLMLNNIGLIWRASRKTIDPQYTGLFDVPRPMTIAAGVKMNF